MALLQRLKTWGAVEKNGRRLHLINISIGYGFPIVFGLLDMLLVRLQHGNLAPVQRVACALQWINVVTVHLMPAHIRQYVEWHCVNSEVSIQTISYIYIMSKITLAVILSIIITSSIFILIISGDKSQINRLYIDTKLNLTTKLELSEKKLLVKFILFLIPSGIIFIYLSLYFSLYEINLGAIGFEENILATIGLLFFIFLPYLIIIRIIYMIIKINSTSKPSKQ